MKKLFLLLFFLWINILQAQNYQNICSQGVTQFIGSDHYFKGFRQDSYQIQGSNDTLFYSYRTTRDSTGNMFGCRDTTNGDALGRRILKSHDGWFFFFNMKNDTIKINSQAAQNESWTYCKLPSSCHLQATVTAIITDSVLGTTDLVKVISFQAKDALNNNVASIFNQKTIKLSQHYGLSKVYDIYWTPLDTLNLSLAGKSSPPLGVQLFTWQDVYNFDVGDEFHYSEYQTYNSYTTLNSKSINKILGKTTFGGDSVIYQVETCKRTIFPMGNITETHDTINETYNFLQLATDSIIRLLPDEFLDLSSITRTYSEFNNRLVLIFNYVAYTYNFGSGQGCIGGPFEMWGPEISYVPGLGLTNWLDSEVDIGVSEHRIDLVYYKKGSEVWGTPVATDCFQLVGIDEKKGTVGSSINIYPNPASDAVYIKFKSPSSGHIEIYSTSGTLLLTQSFTGQELVKSDLSGLSAGMYLIKVISRDSIETRLIVRN